MSEMSARNGLEAPREHALIDEIVIEIALVLLEIVQKDAIGAGLLGVYVAGRGTKLRIPIAKGHATA